ncbi:MAG: carbohydrate-binding protein, partial [Dysgonamonadaceae bacterium]|nr:carbohydrate-binding protein [Dysgonamonadaceae bacterium]
MIKKSYLLFLFVLLGCLTTILQAQTKSWKRGACMSNLREADFEALKTGMTWFYDWGNTPAGVGTAASDARNIEYCPMRWGNDWNPNAIRAYVAAHPNCKYLLTFNEPNFQNQANLTPQQAADRWPEIKALANELNLKIISPALNYSAWAAWGTPKKWLDEFFKLVPKEDVDGIALHCYMGWSDALIGYVKEYIGYYNKPIWLTEFCSWDDRWNTPAAEMQKVQREYLVDTFDFLETEPMVARYAWFMAKTGENNAVPQFPWMQLLNGHNGVLTENGKIFNNMSSYDDNFYHNTQSRIQANHYIRMKGIHLQETNDTEGIINVYDFGNNDYLEYNVDAPSAGDYYLFVRYATANQANLSLLVNNDAKTTITLPKSENNGWATEKFTIPLNAGKQKVRLLCTTSGASVRLNWLNISKDEAAETVGGGGEVTPPEEHVNLALNKPVEASSEQEYGNRLAMFAVDGIIDDNRWATEWEGQNIDNDRWFLVDLQKEYKFEKIVI